MHVLWFRERCTTLETRLTYTSKTIFEAFPWPQSPAEADVSRVAEAAAKIVEHRAAALGQGVTLAAQYNVLREPGRSKLRGLHDRLDAAVLQAYEFDPSVDALTQLLSLNLEVAQREKDGEPVTPPGPVGDKCRISDWRLAPPLLGD